MFLMESFTDAGMDTSETIKLQTADQFLNNLKENLRSDDSLDQELLSIVEKHLFDDSKDNSVEESVTAMTSLASKRVEAASVEEESSEEESNE